MMQLNITFSSSIHFDSFLLLSYCNDFPLEALLSLVFYEHSILGIAQ